MSKFLRDILEHDHPLFSYNLDQLEKAAGEAVAARLVADIHERAHRVLRTLQLDTANTTGEELYHALVAASKRDDARQVFAAANYVLLPYADGPVSLNYQDIVENAHHELSYSDRTSSSAKRHLRTEIMRRYAEHDRTDNALVHKLAAEAGLKPLQDEGHLPLQLESLENAPTLLAVGEIFTDAFIKLREDVATVIEEGDEKRLSLPFGSKPPYDRVDIVRAVGPSPNAAVACARLGLDVSLMAWLGDDQVADDAISHLKDERIDTALTVKQANMPSNYYYVLRLGAERTILVRNENYEYVWKDPKQNLDWIYLSLISDASWQLHLDMLAYLERNPDTKLAFQPGTFHFTWGVEKLKPIYARSHIVVLNREEAVDVTGRSYDNLHDLANGLHDLGPRIVVITDGPNGSYASYDDKLVTIPNYPDPAPPVDRTGAGDAFASTIVAALALGKSMDEALTWAPINSMSVIQKLGAQAGLLHESEIQHYIESAPEAYKVTSL